MSIDVLVRESAGALMQPGWDVLEAHRRVDPVPGLYAIHAASDTWLELGLIPRRGVPLYVGKSETSLVARELEGHFDSHPKKRARTGSSTVRRSFASLLSEQLRLEGRPRGYAKRATLGRGDFTNYELTPEGDERLSAWMHRHLLLSVWPKPLAVTLAELGRVEVALIGRWAPSINIRDNPRKDPRLTAARRRMASEARAWSQGSS